MSGPRAKAQQPLFPARSGIWEEVEAEGAGGGHIHPQAGRLDELWALVGELERHPQAGPHLPGFCARLVGDIQLAMQEDAAGPTRVPRKSQPEPSDFSPGLDSVAALVRAWLAVNGAARG